MTEYKAEIISTIHNEQYTYHKLFINGVCQFDEFESEISDDPIYKKQYAHILAIMEFISDKHMLTKKKFRQIKGVGRDDVYEFKSKDLRIYVVKKSPDMYIVLGGYKKEQTNDIKSLKKTLSEIKL